MILRNIEVLITVLQTILSPAIGTTPYAARSSYCTGSTDNNSPNIRGYDRICDRTKFVSRIF